MRVLKRAIKTWMIVCTLGVTAFLVFYGVRMIASWFAAQKNADVKTIESCLDSGGAWNDDVQMCVHAY